MKRHTPLPHLRPLVLGSIEGWEQTNDSQAQLRQVPFPGVPLIFGLDSAWQIHGPLSLERTESFVAGMHAAPTLGQVRPAGRASSCG